MYYEVEIVNLNSPQEKNEVEIFLSKFDLKYEKSDYTVIIRDNDNIIATCSKLGNVLKCFAIEGTFQGLGISNTLISKVTEKLFNENIYHSYIFTKPDNQHLFENLGYKNIFTTDKVSLLETGNKNINSRLRSLKKEYKIDENKVYSSLVMNCNPFTLGHRHIIEEASFNNDNLIIFVVEEDKSIFSFKDRFMLVKKGVEDLKNVVVIPASEYIISSATFPSYFLKENDNSLKEYTKLDCNIFGKYFADIFNINNRYIGTEPNCEVTNTYNKSIIDILPKYGVNVSIIKRKEINGEVISASKVRQYLKEKNFDKIKEIVPKTTMEFLVSPIGEKVINKL